MDIIPLPPKLQASNIHVGIITPLEKGSRVASYANNCNFIVKLVGGEGFVLQCIKVTIDISAD